MEMIKIILCGLTIVFLLNMAADIEMAEDASEQEEKPVVIIQAEIEPPPDKPAIISAELDKVVEETAQEYGLDPAMVYAVAYTESRFLPTADNGLCYGLMQLNRNYAETFCAGAQVKDIYDPENNIKAGCWWLSELLAWADGNEDLALMAYNLGQSNAKKKWESGEESTQYSQKVQEARLWYERNGDTPS